MRPALAIAGRRALARLSRSAAGLILLLAALASMPATSQAGPPKPAPQAVSAPDNAARERQVEVFVREGCPHCAEAEQFLVRLGKEQPGLRIVIRDVAKEPAALARLQALADQQARSDLRVPAFSVGGQLIVGFSQAASTDKLIRGALQGLAGQTPREQPSCAAQEAAECRADAPTATEATEGVTPSLLGPTPSLDAVGLPAFTLAMGLLDGLNPCSMWVLILMISLLATLQDRRRMLVIAGTFVLVEGVAYFVFMTAWLNLFLLIGLSRPSQLVIAAIAVAAGLVNVKDFWAPGLGVSLSISEQSKPGIYARMRAILQARDLPAAIVGVIVLGLLVQVVEFLCTSGFPALFTRILTLRQLDTASYYTYLLLYNAAYMLDDVVVLAIGVVTLSHHRLQEKEGRWLKLLSGVVMIALGIYLAAAA